MTTADPRAEVPAVLAGPILRRLAPTRITVWMATRAPAAVKLDLAPAGAGPRQFVLDADSESLKQLRAGQLLNYVLLDLELDEPLPTDTWIGYQIAVRLEDASNGWEASDSWAPGLAYPNHGSPGFEIPSRVNALLHGSCRKPHHPSGDALVAADQLLAQCAGQPPQAPSAWPSGIVMSGDQIYADDVAGPMLRAIHALTERLGLPNEDLEAVQIPNLRDTRSLYADPDTYYRREALLPAIRMQRNLLEILFGGVRKPIFTTVSAHNHLITLGEVLAMYLLVWSPTPWQLIDVSEPPGLTPSEHERYTGEHSTLDEFVAGLDAVRRAFAHLPVAMIFDDHDITDDWNLNRAWEESADEHPFSRRVIGNALVGYLINQAWGNQPEAFDGALLAQTQSVLDSPGGKAHDELINVLSRFQNWDFVWPTEPPLIVLDTRTRRWRSEGSPHRPSGLLDWEAITDLQHTLRGRDAVMLVSAAPIFGVKLIETIQKIFTWFGKPLMVDAENWMAHPGTADAILNVFRHPRTPRRFVVLSGDVHYSFVYDVELRGRVRGPDIWQICSSGLRNEFPQRLLDMLDRLNRWLYSPRSPLNWLTTRRRMRVIPRKPVGTPSGRRLLNKSGIGLVELDGEGSPWRIRQLLADHTLVPFVRREDESRWD